MKIRNIHNTANARGLAHRNLIVTPTGIIEFTGVDIPGVLRIIETCQTFWRVELADDAFVRRYVQDRLKGVYFPCSSWEEACERLDARLAGQPSRMGITMEALEASIRSIFPRSAWALDHQECPAPCL